MRKIAVVSARFLPASSTVLQMIAIFSFRNGYLIPLCGLFLHTVVLSLNIISFPRKRLD